MPYTNVGYGQIARNLIPKIAKHHPSAFYTNFGVEGYYKLEGYNFFGNDVNVPVYAKGVGDFHEEFISMNYKDFNADVYMPIYDVWAHRKTPEIVRKFRLNYVPYCPVDTDILNPIYREHLKSAFRIIPMSKHSEKCIREHFDDKCLPTIYPGINLDLYKPMWNTIEEKNKLKPKAVGFKEDDFIISCMGDIKGRRKAWAENIEGIRIFKENNPDIKTKIYFHSLSRPINPIDFNVPELLKQNNLQNDARMIEQSAYLRGVSDQEMVELYNASDVYCCASSAEGFGLQYIENAACGTPSINSDFTSGREVVLEGKTGYLAKPKCLITQPMIAKKCVPDPYSIAEQLSKIANSDPMKWRKHGPEFAKSFDWESKIIPQWVKTLQRLEEEIEKSCFKPPEISNYLKEKSKKISII